MPRFQVICCLDEREESFRRHLEELAPDAETFGTAGFFTVAMYYRGAADAHFVPLCPAVIRPQHWVVEQVVDSGEEDHRRRARTRRMLGTASHRFHIGSRSLTPGGAPRRPRRPGHDPAGRPHPFPRLTARRPAFDRPDRPRAATDPPASRADRPDPGPDDRGIGFTLDEMTDIAEKVLRDIGLTSRFSRLVLMLGHGSTSMNNPHDSAYDCGACGGARGGPNARALAQILNDPRVRERLAQRGLSIPTETYFVGGLHNTSNDSVTFFDLDRIPDSHRQEFEEIRAVIDAGLRAQRPRALPAVPLGAADALVRRRPPARRGPGRGPGAGPAGVGTRDQRHHHRRPARVDPRPVPRPPGVPHLVRPDARTTPRDSILTRIL